MKILIPLDGSELALDAVHHALHLLREGLAASFVLATVQEPAGMYEILLIPDAEARATVNQAVGAQALERGAALCTAAGASFELDVRTGYAATIDASKLGMGATAHVLVTLESQHGPVMDAFERAISKSPSVMRCELVSGAADYLITLAIRSLDDFARMHREELANLPGVARLESSFVLKRVVNRTAPPRLLSR